jgi:hypothetical protein
MKPNELLLWISSRRQGTWSQFRAAVEELHADDTDISEPDEDTTEEDLPLHMRLRLNFQRFGHAEFFQGEDESYDWRVTPPLLASTEVDGVTTVILTGARTPKMVVQLESLGKFNKINFNSAPDAFVLTADREEVNKIGNFLRIPCQFNTCEWLLSTIPYLSGMILRRTEPPYGATHTAHFSTDTLTWKKTDREAALEVDGFYRFSMRFGSPAYVLRRRGVHFSVLNNQIGKFFALAVQPRKRRIFMYRKSTRELVVPAICQPPLLLERVLILCSGYLPDFDASSHSLTYNSVPPHIAQSVATHLSQELG